MSETGRKLRASGSPFLSWRLSTIPIVSAPRSKQVQGRHASRAYLPSGVVLGGWSWASAGHLPQMLNRCPADLEAHLGSVASGLAAQGEVVSREGVDVVRKLHGGGEASFETELPRTAARNRHRRAAAREGDRQIRSVRTNRTATVARERDGIEPPLGLEP